MTLLDVSLAEEPLDVDSFSYLSDEDYPFVLLGFQLKNLYDQKRLIIQKEYNPVDIIHFIPNEPIMPKFFRGIKLQVREKYFSLLRQLNAANLKPGISFTRENYKHLLGEFGLKSDNCLNYLDKGVYPIDSEYLNDLCTLKIKNTELYEQVLNTEEYGFLSYGYFTIYVLSNNNVLKTTTKNFINTAIKNYNNP